MSLRNSSLLDRLRKSLVRNVPAKVVSLAVAVVVFFFVRTTSLEQRFITVPLELRIAARYTVTAGLPATATITLRGEGDSIFQVSPDDIVVYVDLMDHRNEGVFRVPVRFEKKREAAVVEPLEVSIEPAEVTATIEQIVTRTLRVLPVIGEGPPPGFILAGYTVEPSTAQVSGPRTSVQGLQALPTEPVNLSDTREDAVIAVKLDYDSRLFRLSTSPQVELSVRIHPEVPAAESLDTEPAP